MNEFSTAGIKVYYAVEVTAGTRPTSGYTHIAGIKSTPDFNESPENLDVTDLADAVYRRSIPGLIPAGDSQAFRANLTTAFKTAWAGLVTASETAKASGKATWFEIAIPNFDSFYFAGIPTPLGVSGFEVGQVAEIDAYVTPNQIEGWASASTKE